MSRQEVDLDRVLQGTLFGEGVLNASVAALLAANNGDYIAVNDAACQLTGYARMQLMSLPLLLWPDASWRRALAGT